MRQNIVKDKSYAFALSIIKVSQMLVSQHKEFVLSRQVLKSGTAVGALVREAEHAQSRADFVNKMNISLKEANETEYWLSLLKDAEYIDPKEYESLNRDILELIRLLASIVKTVKTENRNG